VLNLGVGRSALDYTWLQICENLKLYFYSLLYSSLFGGREPEYLHTMNLMHNDAFYAHLLLGLLLT
jgi:hypothetical protein